MAATDYIVPQPSPATSSADEVFSIYELCEQILGSLTPQDLFHAQFICRYAHDVVKGSQKLQIKLFRHPAETTRWDFKSGSGELLRVKVPPNIRQVLGPHVTARPHLMNTFLFKPLRPHPGVVWNGNRRHFGEILAVNVPLNYHVQSLSTGGTLLRLLNEDVRFPDRDATCLQMFLTQPPITKAEVCIEPYALDLEDPWHYLKVEKEEGVRLGDVLKVANDWNHRYHNTKGRRNGHLVCVKVHDDVVVTPETKAAVEALLAAHGASKL